MSFFKIMEELSELKKYRKRLNLTQKELAKRANVSQSLIAKIESGKVDPSYRNAKKIFETLSLLKQKNELKARDIMHKKVIYAKSSDTLKDTIKKMRQKNISQLPVLKHNKVIGYISESLLLDKLLNGETQSKVGNVVEPSPPIVPPNTSQGVIAHLLKHFPFVLVKEKENIVGIITKVDLLKIVYGKS